VDPDARPRSGRVDGRALHLSGVGRPAPWVGYLFAVINAIVSGVAVYVSSLGVGLFTDPVLFTSLKNGVVGALLLIPLLASARQRGRFRGLRRSEWVWLVVVALVGGSVPYALYFTGLKSTTPVTGALGDHLQFALVVVLAVALLKERLTATMWAGMAALLAGVLLSANLGLLAWNGGTVLILISTVLFSIEWVIVRYLLQARLRPLTVMTAKMTLGSAMLFGYLAIRGGLDPIAHLSPKQWFYAVGTGGLLLVFTASIFIAIHVVRVSAVMAIGAAAPLVTIALQLATGHRVGLSASDLGLLLILGAVVVLIVLGIRQDTGEPRQVDAARSDPA
jgi:drug/metabolite transporter (DMT)-like permease